MWSKKSLGMLLGLFCVGFAGSALAAEGSAIGDEVKKWLGLSAGFGIAIATFGGALGQARAVAAAVTGIARNPGASGKIFLPMILGVVFIESLVLYTFVIAYLLNGKI